MISTDNMVVMRAAFRGGSHYNIAGSTHSNMQFGTAISRNCYFKLFNKQFE